MDALDGESLVGASPKQVVQLCWSCIHAHEGLFRDHAVRPTQVPQQRFSELTLDSHLIASRHQFPFPHASTPRSWDRHKEAGVDVPPSGPVPSRAAVPAARRALPAPQRAGTAASPAAPCTLSSSETAGGAFAVAPPGAGSRTWPTRCLLTAAVPPWTQLCALESSAASPNVGEAHTDHPVRGGTGIRWSAWAGRDELARSRTDPTQ
jgi:hypothetical protein